MAETSEGIPLWDNNTLIAPLHTAINSLMNAINAALVRIKNDFAGLASGANFYTGTNAQRNAALSTRKEGDAWQDTDGEKSLYIKKGGSWVGASPAVDEIDLKSDIVSTYRNVFNARTQGRVVCLRFHVPDTVSIPQDDVHLGVLRSAFRPTQTITGSARFYGGTDGTIRLGTSGNLLLRNKTGAIRQGVEFSLTYIL